LHIYSTTFLKFVFFSGRGDFSRLYDFQEIKIWRVDESVLKLLMGRWTADICFAISRFSDSWFTLLWLLEANPHAAYDERIYISAAGHNIHCLKKLRLATPDFILGEKTFNAVVCRGTLATLEWLCTECDAPCLFGSSTFIDAAHRGDVGILQWLVEICNFAALCSKSTFVAGAGNLEVLKLLRKAAPDVPWTENICKAAATKGNLDVLKWLRTECSPPCPWDASVCAAAAARGDVQKLSWLRNVVDPPCPWDETVCVAAELKPKLET